MLNHFQKAQIIYNQLINLDIEKNAADIITNNKLKLARELTSHYVSLARFTAPGLTTCVATTLLGVGYCQELSQRFALEYVLKYQEQDVHIVFTHNPANFHENHAFVVVGTINIPDSMFIGRGTGPCVVSNKPMNLDHFFNTNKEAIVVDLLTNCIGNDKASLTGLLNYFKEQHITEVSGVRSYQHFIAIVENAPRVSENALSIAHQIRAQFSHVFPLLKEQRIIKNNLPQDAGEKKVLLSHSTEESQKFMFFTEAKHITPGDLPNILAAETLTPHDLQEYLLITKP